MSTLASGDRDCRQHKPDQADEETQMRKLIDVNQDILEPPEPVNSVVVIGSKFGTSEALRQENLSGPQSR
jgi:hypothetical protein